MIDGEDEAIPAEEEQQSPVNVRVFDRLAPRRVFGQPSQASRSRLDE
jgi:hypothetical protein